MQAGAKAAANPREVGAASEIVVTMMPEPQHVEQVVLGKDGLVESLPKGAIVIEMSTIDPGTSRRVGDALRARGMVLISITMAPLGRDSARPSLPSTTCSTCCGSGSMVTTISLAANPREVGAEIGRASCRERV